MSRVTVSVNDGTHIDLKLVGDESSTVRGASGELAGLRLCQDNWVRIQVVADKVYTRILRLPPAQ